MTGHVIAVVLGAVGVAWILTSVIRTVVIPRPERVWLTMRAFAAARFLADRLSRPMSPQRRHRVLGAYGPTVLVSLPLVWSAGLIGSFALIYWGLEVGSVGDAVELSGSSLTTLGFVPAPTFTTRILAVMEALVGLAVLALMIGFLPTLYSTFSRREIAVGRLTTRAGMPPDPVVFVTRLDAIGRLDHVGERWEEWEDWFVELGETHTSFPALVYFRSADPDRSWLTAAEVALDTAALVRATNLVEQTGQADTMIRAGYLALRSIADFYRVEPESEPAVRDGLSVTRDEFERLLDRLEAEGIVVQEGRDSAWESFAGWRVNYDRAVAGLRARVGDVPTHWSSYRS